MPCHSRSLSAARRCRRGIALVLVLIVVAMMTIIGAVLLASESLAGPMSRLSADRLRARMIAEAALAMAVEHVGDSPNWRAALPNGRWINEQAMNSGTFTLYGEDGTAGDTYSAVAGDGSLADDAADPVTLTVVAGYGEARHTARLTLTPTSGSSLAVATRLEVRNSGRIDSYSSSGGAYNPATAGRAAIASSNDIGRPSVTLRNVARVSGDILVGPGGTPASAVQRLDWATLTGSISALPGEIPIVRPAEPPGMPASAGDRTFSSGTQNLSGNVHYGSLTLSGTAILNVQGSVNLLLDGDLLIGDDAVIQFGDSGAYGVAVSGTVEALDFANVDSYDSSIGAYQQANNSGGNAVLATNRTGAGSIIADGGDILGNAFAGVGAGPGAFAVSGGGQITGQRGALTQALDIPVPPAWPVNVGVNLGNYVKNGGTYTINANMQVDAFELDKKAVVRISGHRTIRVNRGFVVDGQSRIELEPNSSLRIYAGEDCTFTNHSKVNANTANPSLVTICCRGGGRRVMIDTQAQVHAVVDAPNSWMSLLGHGEFFGAFMGSRLRIESHARFHHDRNPALATANPRLLQMPPGVLNLFTRGGVSISSRAQVNAAASDPSRVALNHLSDQPIDLSGNCVVFASVTAADAAFTARGGARFTGRVRAMDVALRDMTVTATDGSAGAANPGILADQSVEMSGSARLNSTGGPAILAVNRASTAVIYLRDIARLEGNAFGGPAGDQDRDIRVHAAALLRGSRANLSSPISIALPPAPPVSGTPADYRIINSTSATLSSDLTCKDFEIRDNGRLAISGNVTIVVNGAFRVRDNAQLTLKPGARATIWFNGPSEFSGDARINPDGKPAALALYNHGTTAVELRDRARLWTHVTSPSADWKVGGQSHLFGSFKGRKLTVHSAGQFHQEAASAMGQRWIE